MPRVANPEAERGDAAVGNTHGERPNRPAGGGASLKPAIRKGILGIEFRLPAESECASSLEARKCVCGRGLLDSGGPRPRKVLRQGESHETHGKACKGHEGRPSAAADTQVPQGRSHARRRMPQTRGRNSARRAFSIRTWKVGLEVARRLGSICDGEAGAEPSFPHTLPDEISVRNKSNFQSSFITADTAQKEDSFPQRGTERMDLNFSFCGASRTEIVAPLPPTYPTPSVYSVTDFGRSVCSVVNSSTSAFTTDGTDPRFARHGCTRISALPSV